MSQIQSKIMIRIKLGKLGQIQLKTLVRIELVKPELNLVKNIDLKRVGKTCAKYRQNLELNQAVTVELYETADADDVAHGNG